MNKINMPNVVFIGEHFFSYNNSIEEIRLNKAKYIKVGFFYYSEVLKVLELNNIISIGYDAVYNNKNIEIIKLPNSFSTDGYDFYKIEILKENDKSKLKEINKIYRLKSKIAHKKNLKISNLKKTKEMYEQMYKENSCSVLPTIDDKTISALHLYKLFNQSKPKKHSL